MLHFMQTNRKIWDWYCGPFKWMDYS